MPPLYIVLNIDINFAHSDYSFKRRINSGFYKVTLSNVKLIECRKTMSNNIIIIIFNS